MSVPRTSHPHPRAVLAALALAAALAACSASGSGGSDSGGVDRVAQDGAGQDTEGVAQADGDPAGSSVRQQERQVVQTGTLTLEVSDPTTAVKSVVGLVEDTGGRVDSRQEQAGRGDEPGSAVLTVRVPADRVTATLDTLGELGTVAYLDLRSEDVTAVAQDLAARIAAQEISVARMEGVLSRAVTTSDVVAAENALTERQANLESMRAQAARIAEEVALSTLTITVVVPGPTSGTTSAPTSFTQGLAIGWHALLVAARAVLVTAGVLLPWLALPVLTLGAVLGVRRRRGPRSPGQQPTGA